MKNASAGLIAFLNTSQQFNICDLYTISLVGGGNLRYTTADMDIVSGGFTFSSTGPVINRGTTRTFIGVDVDELEVRLAGDTADLVNGVPILQAAARGAFDGAELKLERCFMQTYGDTSLGTIIMFLGRIANVAVDRTEATLNVKSHLELLNVKLPRNLYVPTCLNALFDSVCNLSKAAYAVSGNTTANSTTSVINSNLGATANGNFSYGTITFTSGTNNGVSRSVKAFASGQFTLMSPLVAAPLAGDTFNAYPGCDKKMSTCGYPDGTGLTVTFDATNNTVVRANQPFIAGDAVRFTTTANLAAPLTVNTPYYVVSPLTGNFKLSATPGGAQIDLTNNGSGTNKVVRFGKFNNLSRFRGFPYIPIPEEAV